jgi:hypothetical protein
VLGLIKQLAFGRAELSIFVIWDFALAREIPNNVSRIVHNLKDCPKEKTVKNRKNSFLYQIRIYAFSDRNTLSLRTSKKVEKYRQGCMEFPASAGNSIHQKEKFHSAEGPCLKRATSLCKQINRIWYYHGEYPRLTEEGLYQIRLHSLYFS